MLEIKKRPSNTIYLHLPAQSGVREGNRKLNRWYLFQKILHANQIYNVYIASEFTFIFTFLFYILFYIASRYFFFSNILFIQDRNSNSFEWRV